ncbi:MAG: hypothetical protein FWE69_05315 [Clostridiales bacterium]|nr:hypothetical protein [Clostridiales bacterium]
MFEKPQQPPTETQGPPQDPLTSPLSCAVALGEYIRLEYGKQGVQEFVQSLSRLVPQELCGQMAERLHVAPPAPPPPLFREYAAPPRRQPEMGMDQIMQMMQMMQMMGKVNG